MIQGWGVKSEKLKKLKLPGSRFLCFHFAEALATSEFAMFFMFLMFMKFL